MSKIGNEKRQQNLALVQKLNEQYSLIIDSLLNRSVAPTIIEPEFICECSSVDCDATILLTTEEFDEIHSAKGQYLVVPEHVDKAHDEVKVIYPLYSAVVVKADIL